MNRRAETYLALNRKRPADDLGIVSHRPKAEACLVLVRVEAGAVIVYGDTQGLPFRYLDANADVPGLRMLQ